MYCTKERGIAECGSVENAERNLRLEVETYDQYLTGDVYGCVVEALNYTAAEEGTDDWETINSCWGFYGSNPRTNGMADHLADEELIASACAAEIEYPSY